MGCIFDVFMYIVGEYKGFLYTKCACMSSYPFLIHSPSFGNIMYSLKVVEQYIYLSNRHNKTPVRNVGDSPTKRVLPFLMTFSKSPSKLLLSRWQSNMHVSMYPYGNKQADKFLSTSILKGRWNYAYKPCYERTHRRT